MIRSSCSVWSRACASTWTRFVRTGGQRSSSLVKVEEILDAKHFRGIDLLGTIVEAGTSYRGWIIPGLQGEWEVV